MSRDERISQLLANELAPTELDRTVAGEFGCSEAAARAARLRYLKKQTPVETCPDAIFSELVSEVRRNYHFDSENDKYYVYIRGRRNAYCVPGVLHRQMKEAYSRWDGDEHTLNMVCNRFGISRKDFEGYKTACGWTHDSSPFSDEELITRDVGDLQKDLARMRERTLEQKDRKRQREIEVRDAAAYRALRKFVIEPGLRFLANSPPRAALPIEPFTKDDPFAVINLLTDIHFGAIPASPEIHNSIILREQLLDVSLNLAQTVESRGRPEVIVIPVGSDFFHVDNALGTTSSGRVTCAIYSTPEQMMFEGVKLFIEIVDIWRSLGRPIRLIPMRGNHDAMLGMALLAIAQYRYQDCPDVTVDISYDVRTYHRWRNHLFGFHHGHSTPFRELPMLMATEQAHLWGECPHRFYFTGHLHHEKFVDLGVGVYQAPAIADLDQYHKNKGYVKSSRAASVGIFRESGVHSFEAMRL